MLRSMIIIAAVTACAVAADEPSAQRNNRKPKPAPPPAEGSDSVPTDQRERIEFFASRLKDLRMHGLDVLLEARNAGGELTWHYMVSRLTRFGTTFSLDEQKIAEFPRLDKWPPTGMYFHHPVSMPDYPFKNTRKAD